jgi:hypothetical protein
MCTVASLRTASRQLTVYTTDRKTIIEENLLIGNPNVLQRFPHGKYYLP